jgi:hypothetical protein
LAEQVNKQSWDPSVKALAQFPSVLANMDKNLSWTSSLGDAYVNQSQDVMNAVQVMRGRAQGARNLKSTPQENVATQGQTITIDPVNPDVVYVPPYTIHGSCMAHHSECGPTGIHIQGSISLEQELPLAWDLDWVSSRVMDGDGATGDSTGITER